MYFILPCLLLEVLFFLLFYGLVQIFFTGGEAAADVALGFVGVQNVSGFRGQRWVDLEKTFCYVFVYRRFRYSKPARRLPHRCLILYDIIGDFYCSFFDIISHKRNPCTDFLQSMRRSFYLLRSSLHKKALARTFYNLCKGRFFYLRN